MSKEAMKLACKALRDCHYYMINAGLPNQSLLNEAFTAYMELEAALAEQPAQQEPWLLETTQTLAKNLAREFYPEVTQWECLNDLAGVISQIDNMTTGLMRKPAQQEPVAFLVDGDLYHPEEVDWETLQEQGHTVVFLYTTPPAAQSNEREIRNATLDEIAAKIDRMPFGDTAASFAVWIREQKQ